MFFFGTCISAVCFVVLLQMAYSESVYNPPDYSIGRHVFLSGILSVLSGGTVNLLTLVTMNIIYINSRC